MKLHPPGLEGFDTGRLERIIPVFQQYVDQGIFAGFSLEIARNGNVIFQQQIGFTDLESELPIQADTLFRIYSMTKPITATAIMILHEEGKFQLSDPISKYISAFDKMSVLEAASAGAWLHGDIAKKYGRGLISEDLIKGIPSALKRLKNEWIIK